MTTNSSLATSTLAAVSDVHSDAALRRFKVVVDVYVVGALCAFGIAGNVLSIVVLGRDRTVRRTTGFMLQTLAVADAVYLVCCLVYQSLNCAVKWTDWLPAAVHRGWPYVEVSAWPLASVAQTATVWHVVELPYHLSHLTSFDIISADLVSSEPNVPCSVASIASQRTTQFITTAR